MKEEHKNNDPEKLIFRKALDDLKIEPSEKFWNAAFFTIDSKGSGTNEPSSAVKEEFVNSDPEKLVFKKTLDNHKIEPSEKFWNTALHNIINKESTLRIKQVRIWKLVSAGLAIVIAAFCVQEVMLYNKMDKIEQQVSELKMARKQVAVSTSSPIAIGYPNNIVSNQSASVYAVPEAKHELQNSKMVSATNYKVLLEQNPINNVLHQYKGGSESSNLGRKVTVKQNNIAINHSNTEHNAIASNELHTNSGNALVVTKQENTSTENSEAQIALLQNNNKQDSANTAAGSLSNTNTETVAQTKDVKQDSAATVTNTAEALPPIEGEKKANGFLHRLSVSAFFTPGILSSKLYDNNSDDEIHPSDISSRESGDLAWQAGFNMGMDIGKFTLSTGLYYYNYSDNIKQTDLTARELDDGTIGYSIVTSSGVVDIPSSATSSSTGGATHKGDSMKIYGSTVRAYACIPLQLSYAFAVYKKIDFFGRVGITFNIASYSSTSLSWQDANMDEGNIALNSVDGLRKLQLGYNVGFGASYSLSKHFLIYLEPIIRGSITSVSKDAPVSNYPLFFGSSVGLTYHF